VAFWECAVEKSIIPMAM